MKQMRFSNPRLLGTIVMLPVVVVLIGAASPLSAESGESGFHLYSETTETQVTSPVVGSLMYLKVGGTVARGKIHQIFLNPTDEWLSGVYLFPTPENAAIDSLRMKVGERVLEAEIAENQEARVLYQEARRTGVKASLLEQIRPNVFTMSVAQIGPGEEIEVEIELQFEIRSDAGRFRLQLPLLVAERASTPKLAEPAGSDPDVPAVPQPPRISVDHQASHPVAIRVDLATGYPLQSITSPTHEVRLVESSGWLYEVELEDELVLADGDFVLEWEAAPGVQPEASIAYEHSDGYYYALLTVLPPTRAPDDRLPREVIFVVDTSGSMKGASLRQAKRAVRLALDDLRSFDSFNVIRFSDAPESLFGRAVAADEDSIEHARTWVSGLRANGGTQLVPALVAALENTTNPALLRQVVFVTDGQVENELSFFQRLRKLRGSTRLFPVGIGSAPNAHFMRRAAELGQGTFTLISDRDDVRRQIGALVRKLTAPVLTDLEVAWDDPTAESWPRELGDLYLGEPLVVASRLRNPGNQVTLTGRIRDQLWRKVLPLTKAVPVDGIGKLWARRQVESLGDALAGDEADREEIRRQIVELALTHRLVTPYTSLVALDDWAEGHVGGAPEKMIPVHSPRGTSGVSQGGSFDSSGQFTEELIVTSQAPMIDSTTTCLSAVQASGDVAGLPNFSWPWSLVGRSPGVVTDHQLGSGSVDSLHFGGRGTANDETVVTLDGFEVSDEFGDEASFELGRRPLEALRVDSTGSAKTHSGPGFRVDLTTAAAGNDWKLDATLTGASSDSGEGNRIHHGSAGEVELGGPLQRDYLWFWGALGEENIDRVSFDRKAVRSRLDNATGELSAMSANTSVSLSWHAASGSQEGLGAGPERALEATWNRASDVELSRLRASSLVSPQLVLSGSYGELDRRFMNLPRGGSGVDVFVDALGVVNNSTFALTGQRSAEEWDLSGNVWFSSYRIGHELEFGLESRRAAALDQWLGGGAVAVEVGKNLAARGFVATSWLDTRAETQLHHTAGWLQDSLQFGRVTVVAGLRWDRQQGISAVAVDAADEADGLVPEMVSADWSAVSPRVGLSLALDRSERMVLRAEYGRYSSNLGSRLASRLDPGFPVFDQEVVFDGGGDVEVAARRRHSWLSNRPDELAGDLEPEKTDRALIGFEYEFRHRFFAGVTFIHRRSHGLHERRLQIRDSDEVVRLATKHDWQQLREEGALVSAGSVGDLEVYDLRPGLELMPTALIVNGDRSAEQMSASLTWRGSFGNRWTTDGHISWSDSRWHLGEQFRWYQDPTNLVGNQDDQAAHVFDFGPRNRGLGTALAAVDSRWTLDWSVVVEIPHDVTFGFVVSAHEGSPLPFYRRIARDRAGIAFVEQNGMVGEVRAPDVVTADLRLTKKLDLGNVVEMQWVLEVFNLADSRTVIRRELDLGVGRGGEVAESMVSRVWRLGTRLSW